MRIRSNHPDAEPHLGTTEEQPQTTAVAKPFSTNLSFEPGLIGAAILGVYYVGMMILFHFPSENLINLPLLPEARIFAVAGFLMMPLLGFFFGMLPSLLIRSLEKTPYAIKGMLYLLAVWAYTILFGMMLIGNWMLGGPTAFFQLLSIGVPFTTEWVLLSGAITAGIGFVLGVIADVFQKN